MRRSSSELSGRPEKKRRKKEKRSTPKITNEDHNPQNDAVTMITPLIDEPEPLSSESEALVALLNSELSATEEEKVEKEPKAEISHRPKTDSEEKRRKRTKHEKKKKLLILDLNGLLADIVQQTAFLQMDWDIRGYEPYDTMGEKAVFKRPFCDEFLAFCFRNFHVAVWSSRAKYNKNKAVNLLFKDHKSNLFLSWDRSKCTITRFKTPEDNEKPLVLKELTKVWEANKGFDESNTLLVDDSPYKALLNPAYTAIFPFPYKYDHRGDRSLSSDGELRKYLERLAGADNVQKFVEENPFGQRAITEASPSWNFYKKVIDSVPEKVPEKQRAQHSRRRR